MSAPGPKGQALAPTGTGPVPAKPGQKGNFLSAEKLATVLEICEAVAEGNAITELLDTKRPGKPAHWPSWPGFSRLMAEFPAVREAYKTAREISAQSLEDRALAVASGLIAPGAEYTATFVSGASKAMEQFRWSAERRSPGDFGTKAAQTTIVPIQINTTLDLGQPGGGSAVDAGNPFSFTVDAEALPVPEGVPDAPVAPQDPVPERPAPGTAPKVPPARELPPEEVARAARFGITEVPRSAVLRNPGGRPRKPRLIGEDGKPRLHTEKPRPRSRGMVPKGYAAQRIAEIKADPSLQRPKPGIAKKLRAHQNRKTDD